MFPMNRSFICFRFIVYFDTLIRVLGAWFSGCPVLLKFYEQQNSKTSGRSEALTLHLGGGVDDQKVHFCSCLESSNKLSC